MAGRPYVTSRSGRFQWLMQRVSAVLLLALVFVHFAIQHFTADAVTTGLTVSARFNDPYWQGFYVIFVVLGLYHGVNMLERDTFYSALPDRVVIYRGPITRVCRSRREVIREVRDTVIHELGHYFGMEEDQMPY